HPFVFSAVSTSDLGYLLLSAVNSGRLKIPRPPPLLLGEEEDVSHPLPLGDGSPTVAAERVSDDRCENALPRVRVRNDQRGEKPGAEALPRCPTVSGPRPRRRSWRNPNQCPLLNLLPRWPPTCTRLWNAPSRSSVAAWLTPSPWPTRSCSVTSTT